jgi:hypothetical protein
VNADVHECVFGDHPIVDSDPPEHVFPQWVSRALLEIPGGTGRFTVVSDLPGFEAFECDILEITTRNVCADCNHGWMSILESKFSRLGSQMVKGERTTVSQSELILFTRWAVKTALAIDVWFSDQGGERLAPTEHCREFAKTLALRNGTYVFTTSAGYNPATQTYRDSWAARTKLGTHFLASGVRSDGYAVTWHFGYLAIQVVCLGPDDDQLNAFGRADLYAPDGQTIRASDAFAQVAPPTVATKLVWPPPKGLEQIGLALWAEQPPFVA